MFLVMNNATANFFRPSQVSKLTPNRFFQKKLDFENFLLMGEKTRSKSPYYILGVPCMANTCHTWDPYTKYSLGIRYEAIKSDLGAIFRLSMMYQGLRDILTHVSGMVTLSNIFISTTCITKLLSQFQLLSLLLKQQPRTSSIGNWSDCFQQHYFALEFSGQFINPILLKNF